MLSSPANNTITTTTELTLIWQASPDAMGYLLDFNGTVVDVGDTTFSTTGVLADGVYTWTVAAYSALQTSPYADVWSFTVESTGPVTHSVYLALVLNNYDSSQLLRNGNFDTGDFAPWEIEGAPKLNDQVYRSAPYSARLGGRNDVDSDYVYQEVSVPANATEVTLDFWYRVSSGDSSSPADYMCIEILDSTFTTVLVDFGCPELYLEPQDQWINFQHVISGSELTPIVGQAVLVSFQGWTDAADPSTAWVDDVSFKVSAASP